MSRTIFALICNNKHGNWYIESTDNERKNETMRAYKKCRVEMRLEF